MEYCIGIDLGGTNIAGGVATLDGRLVHTQSVKTGMRARRMKLRTASPRCAAVWRRRRRRRWSRWRGSVWARPAVWTKIRA